ncbi:MAG: hypothetical protein GY795_31165, partial [Desulfobacterales bacterium]|nr:hypothetical protein [Desulfobacterales bacterium]
MGINGPTTGGMGLNPGTTTDNTTDTRIPYKDGTTFEDSPLYYDDSVPKVVSDVLLEVPGGTLAVGETTNISASTGCLLVENEVENDIEYVVTNTFDSTGADNPTYLDLGAESVLNMQTDFSETITDNPLTFSVTGTVVAPDIRQFNTVTMKMGVMTNARARFTDNASGRVIRYIPDKASWDAGTGITTVSGDNLFDFLSTAADSPGVFNLGVHPFLVENGQQIDLEFRADTVDIKGNSLDVPYLVADIQDGPHVELPDKETADRHQSTGLLEGGVISIASSTTVDWTAGRGIVADYSDPEQPDITDVSWSAVSGQAVTSVATDGTTLFGYDA